MVPVSEFRSVLGDPNTKLLKACISCRLYQKERDRKRHDKHSEIFQDRKTTALADKTGHMYCKGDVHLAACSSLYPRERVPIELFRKVPNDPKSALFKSCLYCRQYSRITDNDLLQRKRGSALTNNKSLCERCWKEFEKFDMAKNINGTLSSQCIDCQSRAISRCKELAGLRDKIKYEFMEKYQCSCQKCKGLYFSPIDDSLVSIRLQTYLKDDGLRYISYMGMELSVKTCLVACKHLLEFDVIDMDHLTETEQRERGLLMPDEPYVPKTGGLSELYSEDLMRLEARKLQNLCVRCHVEETVRRETLVGPTTKLAKIKKDYVNSLKSQGCSSCGYCDPQLLRFFDMDHLDPTTKIDNVSTMVHDKNRTLQDVIVECWKCRVLCRHCHRINFRKQSEMGLFPFHSDE